MEGLGSKSTASRKRPLDHTDQEQRKKRKKESDNAIISAEVRKLDDYKKNKKEALAARTRLPIAFEKGALRLTRTEGRRAAGGLGRSNSVSLDDLIKPSSLCAALVFSFFIENPYLFQFFPFKDSPYFEPHAHVYVGRDLSMDSIGKQFAGFTEKTPTGADFDDVVGCAQAGYREQYGENFRAFYPRMEKVGCAHSKMMVLIYHDFLRLVITSANFMKTDVVAGDNGWYIQDFPRLPENAKYKEKRFEEQLRRHVEELGCPDGFVNLYLKPGVFDFSAAKVYLVTSKPGRFSGEEAYQYGQLRLRDVVSRKIFKGYSTDNPPPQMEFEICVGSVGHLENEGVVKNFLESCSGNLQKSVEGDPALKMIFPTWADVEASNMPGFSNISSHIDWKKLKEKKAEFLKTVFHHYHSKDKGNMFHLKTVLALHAGEPKRTPLYMYMGSANFSTMAWGAVKKEKRNKFQAATGATVRIESMANFECGVVIRGKDIAGMLETGKWEDIVPYVRPTDANRYKEGERPYKVPKSAFQDPAFEAIGDHDDGDVDEGTVQSGLPSVMNLVRVLSRARVLHLTGKA
ncbi:tyrosyl-DNA phosphodiesterase-domain-containing protein [Mycena galopus ATCC 62051]|nr:tyrosyl-DNA phosphodiesterase-domain-containing protein [Mycena galopus ATCC 62051]